MSSLTLMNSQHTGPDYPLGYTLSRGLFPLTEVTGVVGSAFPTRNNSIALDIVRSRLRVLEVGKFGCYAASIYIFAFFVLQRLQALGVLFLISSLELGLPPITGDFWREVIEELIHCFARL